MKPHKTALVLGTSKRVAPGRINKFYQYRMDAVKSLYAANKIKYVIVSGDNSTIHYNEAREMKKSLIELGIPEEVIIEDFAGFRTLDSVIRAKLVFGQDSLIIVSQPFHNERALFIANHHNIKAIAFNAEKVAARVAPKTYFREVLARVKCVLDLYILGTMPKYYKDQEPFPN